MNTDIVVAISDHATDELNVLFNTPAGHDFLATRRGVPVELIEGLSSLGLSSICNVLAAIKTARQLGLGPEDVIVTVATDGAAMYTTEREKTEQRSFPAGFDPVAAGETFGRHVLGAGPDHLLELSGAVRRRIFNLGYFTWVEQQGIPYDEFVARRRPEFWTQLHEQLAVWDGQINEFNARTGVTARS
jgi:hypothetical protein